MSELKQEKINLNDLSERELLIVVAKNQERLEQKCGEIEAKQQEFTLKQQQMAVDVNTLQTKSSMWGALSGAIAGLMTALAGYFMTRN